MSDKPSDSSSWAELVRSVDFERKNLPWNPANVEPVQRANLYERKKNEREYDLIAMQYRNAEKDDMIKTMKLDKERAKIEKVRDSSLTNFNIISHCGPSRRTDSAISLTQKNKGIPARPFNFVTNLSNSDHQNAPLLYDEEYTISRAGKPKVVRTAAEGTTRGFNIINNHFVKDHDRRKQEEYENFKNHTLEKYWNTHDFDFIRGKFYDVEKEAKYREQRDILSQVHGSSKTVKVPPSIQNCDGNSYNIINHGVHDDDRLSITRTVEERSMNRMKKTAQDRHYQEEGKLRGELVDKASLAKISFKRWENTLDRGFDVIKNSVQLPTELPLPLPQRPITMWERLQSIDNSSINSVGNHRHDNNSNSNMRPPRASTAANTAASMMLSHNRRQPSSATSAGDGGIIATTNTTARIRNLSGEPPSTSLDKYHLQQQQKQLSYPSSPGDASSVMGYSSRDSSCHSSARHLSNSDDSRHIHNSSSGTNNSNQRLFSSGDGGRAPSRPVPSLDLTKAEPPESVRYVEPNQSGPLGQPVAIVRTGGGWG